MPTTLAIIVGDYQDDIFGAWHFFLRTKRGAITTFDVPGVNKIFTNPTFNQEGTVTGTYEDTNGVFHGFVRTAHSAITTINASGAGTGFFQGTSVSSINPSGTIVGHYTDANYVAHGFIWKK